MYSIENFLNHKNLGEIMYWYILPLLIFGLYTWYVKKYKFYKLYEKFDSLPIRNKLPRGKCPPVYPWGWYRLCRSNEIHQGQVEELKICGRHITYYRGTDGVVYAVDSYCTHMGANLSGGKVKHGRCIQCPFHGWTFDGKTGKPVNSEKLDQKEVTVHKYEDITFQNSGKLSACKSGRDKLKTYILREMKGLIFIWLHPQIEKPLFEPVDVEINHLQLRGESINFVNCHIQEIPENGADTKHFDLVHETAVDCLWPYVKLKWQMKTKNASDPDFLQVMTHPEPKYRDYQSNLFRQFLTDKSRLKYMNILSLDGDIVLFNKWRFHAVTATGFQVGPATVSLYVKSPIFEVLFQQAIQPIEKFTLKVYHTIWATSFIPYWLSAYVLYGELRQVLFDVKIWNKKLFSDEVCYNLKNDADRALLQWRNWYSQFYNGCHEFEQQLDKLEW